MNYKKIHHTNDFNTQVEPKEMINELQEGIHHSNDLNTQVEPKRWSM